MRGKEEAKPWARAMEKSLEVNLQAKVKGRKDGAPMGSMVIATAAANRATSPNGAQKERAQQEAK